MSACRSHLEQWALAVVWAAMCVCCSLSAPVGVMSLSRRTGVAQGIHCRFGMTSIIAESHFDGGRNFIAMVRGKKRYIINPPSECRCGAVPCDCFTSGAVACFCDLWIVIHPFLYDVNVLLFGDSKLHMLKEGAMKRHASFDWSDPSKIELFGDAQGLEVRPTMQPA